MDEIFEITEFVQEEAGYGTDLIWGNCYDESLGDQLSVTVIATGFEHSRLKTKGQESDRVIVSLDDDSKPKAEPGKPKLKDIGFEESERNAQTFEFEGIRDSVDHLQNHRFSYKEPYLKDEGKEEEEDEKRRRYLQEQKRRERMRGSILKLNNPQTVIELENEPAYLRRGIDLDDVPHSEEEAFSKYTISDDEEPEISEGNSFLHDNVD